MLALAHATLALSILVLAIWLGLWLAHAGFWRIEREPVPPPPADWPDVVCIIPARDEAAVIGETLRSLWAQDYAGALRVVVVDDHSGDGTAEEALRSAQEAGRAGDLTVLAAEALPEGWTGKVWAMQQGLARGLSANDPATFVLFSDADIRHGPGALRELACRAEAGGCDLASFMVRLRCESPAERLMIPAFVFFFRLLYPFRRVNDPGDTLAGAAGGTMLVRRAALERIGGLAPIRDALIDDCSLAREIKRGGPKGTRAGHRLWLGLSDTSESTRAYGSMGEILHMIARTAYTQLGYSPLRLAGCVAGLGITFLAPPLLLLAGPGMSPLFGGAAWLLMAWLYRPMCRFYRRPVGSELLLPITATLYLWATLLSAWRYHRGRGGQWKGRVLRDEG